jgi:hypothetical protein
MSFLQIAAKAAAYSNNINNSQNTETTSALSSSSSISVSYKDDSLLSIIALEITLDLLLLFVVLLQYKLSYKNLVYIT